VNNKLGSKEEEEEEEGKGEAGIEEGEIRNVVGGEIILEEEGAGKNCDDGIVVV
jgi:hypothetical protein